MLKTLKMAQQKTTRRPKAAALRRHAAATWWSEECRQTGQGLRSRHEDCGAVIHHSDRSPLRAHQVRHEATAPRRRRRWVVRIRGCRGVDTSPEPRYARNGQSWRRGVSKSKSTTRAGAAAVTGSFPVCGGQAQVVACGRTLQFYQSVYSPKRSASFKLLPRAVRPFHARLGTSLPSHSSSSKASAATGEKSCNIELCSVHTGKFPNVRTMPSNFSCLVGRPREGETLKGGESGLP